MFDLLISGYFAFSFCFKFIICVAICSHCLGARPQNFGVGDGGGGSWDVPALSLSLNWTGCF